jgi:hypothetical protein
VITQSLSFAQTAATSTITGSEFGFEIFTETVLKIGFKF